MAIVIELSFAIAGSIIIGINKDAINERDHVWIYILVQTILEFVYMVALSDKERNKKEIIDVESTAIILLNPPKKKLYLSDFIGFVNTGIAIWGIVIYFQSNSKKFYKENYYSLWRYLQVIVIYHLICMSFFILTYFLKMINYVCGKMYPRHHIIYDDV